MVRILGSHQRLCDGWTRREMLRAGGLSMFGLGLADLLRAQAQAREAARRAASGSGARPASFGRAKRCIILYLYGAPPQHELFDPKPDAPDTIRGELNPISTSVPGVQISELLPRIAERMHRATLVRSMTHPYNIHSVAYTLTGVPLVDIPMELNPIDTRHWPYIGSVLDYLRERAALSPVMAEGRGGGEGANGPAVPPPRPSPPRGEGVGAPSPPRGEGVPPSLPQNIVLPWQFSTRCPQFKRAGPYAAFLGSAYNPIFTEFEGEPTRSGMWGASSGEESIDELADPYGGITPESYFQISAAARMQPEMTLDRLDRRRSLLEQLEARRRAMDESALGAYDRFQQMAFSLINSRDLRDGLDVHSEPPEVRERYGMTLFGQAVLAARRLLERDVKLVTVFWDEYGIANTAWDTHIWQYPRLREMLCPGLDMAFSALLDDLAERGLLDETLILLTTEHGRTPQLNNASGGGREHWSNAYSIMLAGGGIRGGYVHGESDEHAGFVKDLPVSPKDVLRTVYHLLGVDADTLVYDRLNRPLPLVYEGEVLRELIA